MLPLVGQRHEVLLPDLVRVERDAAAGRIEQRLETTFIRNYNLGLYKVGAQIHEFPVPEIYVMLFLKFQQNS